MHTKTRLDAAQAHELVIDWGSEHTYNAVVLWEPLDDGGTYTAEVLTILFDEWAPDSANLREEALWGFWYDWTHGRVKLYI